MELWWTRLGAPLPVRYLPKDAFSVYNGGLLCGCFLYTMEINGGKAGLIAHTISNPNRKLAGYRAIEEMMQDVKQYGIEEGYLTFMCLTKSRLLASIYEKMGFNKAETVNQYLLK